METELARILDALPGLAWTALPDGQVDFLNCRWHEYTGLHLYPDCGFGWQSVTHQEDLPTLLEHWHSTLAAGVRMDVEARLRRVDGVYRWFLMRANPMRDRSGQICKWFGLGSDVEDCRQLRGATARRTVRSAAERGQVVLGREEEARTLRECYASLSAREMQVMALVVTGHLNKQVGCKLGISEITVKAHRGKVMAKMRANSLPDLVRKADKVEPARQL